MPLFKDFEYNGPIYEDKTNGLRVQMKRFNFCTRICVGDSRLSSCPHCAVLERVHGGCFLTQYGVKDERSKVELSHETKR